MALIEGVGDEVTVLFGLLLSLLVLGLAWISTHTSERGDPPLRDPGTSVSPRPEAAEAPNSGGEAPPGGEDVPLRRRGPGARAEPVPVPAEPPAQSARPGPLVLRLKFLNDSERVARAWPHDTVGSLKRTQFPGQEQQVRLIYQGQLLGDDAQTLGALHLPPNCVLHCHVRAGPPRGPWPPGPEPGPSGLGIGSLLVPLLLLMLTLLWYCQIQYRPWFRPTATLGLAGLTVLAGFLAFAMSRR
ncbi:transmembrane and ubiquitin-like domain-containing protein 1 [Tachyglossus aculeatus]|uniref:transmembrane and ubiquitin-like domain-containing protein 1 n=1 Tax=Tachyglossus aculeatus TaxID=9261 RepID=UPI0018F45343|nr:transmembrane and ubiquitin-like domain-containing protein 1 [Tachyglossus aculeatus]